MYFLIMYVPDYLPLCLHIYIIDNYLIYVVHEEDSMNRPITVANTHTMIAVTCCRVNASLRREGCRAMPSPG